MKQILTALVATILATQAYAGHSMHHDQPHHDQPTITNKPIVPTNKLVTNKLFTTGNNSTNKLITTGNNGKTLKVHDHRDRLRPSDCSDFSYCCWQPHRHSYLFWCAADDYWYYWYGPWDCYLPYDQIKSCPPEANVMPKIPGGLPPVVASDDDDGPSQDTPPMLPTDEDDFVVTP